ncbi:MAG: glycosyltransferase [Bacillota bacterium]
MHDYGPSRTLALYTGNREWTGMEPGSEVADCFANPVRNPWTPSRGSTPALVWLPGDRLISGSPITFRRLLHEQPAQYMVTTLLPLFDGVELVCLEPRLIHDQGPKQHLPEIMMQVQGELPELARKHLSQVNQSWASVKLAMHQVAVDPLAAAAQFEAISRLVSVNQLWAGLATYNQACALIAAGDAERAWGLLQEARVRYSGYKDLALLQAWLLIQVDEAEAAERVLDEAERSKPDTEYFHASPSLPARYHWLRGRIAARSGKWLPAAHHLFQALLLEPGRSIYLEDLIELAPPAPMLRSVLPQLRHVCWTNPSQLPLAVTLLGRAGLPGMCERLVEGFPLTEEQLRDIQSVLPQNPLPQRVAFEGEFLARHSLSRVNRMWALALQREAVDLELVSTNFPQATPDEVPEIAPLLPAFQSVTGRPTVTIRHSWPHDFSPPQGGKLVICLPWEYGSLPKAWFRGLSRADEVWVYTNYVRELMIRDGVEPSKVAVVPCGVDTSLFRPDGESATLPGSKGFTFLFVGGTIFRKGVDLLVDAYCEEFGPDEDVTLVIKDFGSGTVYSDQLLQRIHRRAAEPGVPHILIHRDTLPDQQLAALYRGCGALVHPYRGEGFGLPIAEAMACGAPVIVTGAGACLDFCHEGVAYLVPAQETALPKQVMEELEPTVRTPTWYEVSTADLRRIMRHVFTHRREAKQRGKAAAAWIASRFTWDRAGAIAAERIRRLLSEPERPEAR